MAERQSPDDFRHCWRSAWFPNYYYHLYSSQMAAFEANVTGTSNMFTLPTWWSSNDVKNAITDQHHQHIEPDDKQQHTSHDYHQPSLLLNNLRNVQSPIRKTTVQRQQSVTTKTGFSINDILGRGDSISAKNSDEQHSITSNNESEMYDTEDSNTFSWLNCSRYKPPKVARQKKKDGDQHKKRKLGRNPRVPFTQHQVSSLETKFHQTRYLSSMDVASLSSNLDLTETRVKIWFQNRRARERRERDHKGNSLKLADTFNISSASAPPTDEKKNLFAPIPPSTLASAQFSQAMNCNTSSAFSRISVQD